MERVEETGTGEASFENVNVEEHLRERLFTGLRLAEGIDLDSLSRDLDVPVRQRFAKQIESLQRDGLASLEGPTLRLNERGMDLHSEASLRFF